MAKMGLDVEAVTQVAKNLKTRAAEVEQLVSRIDTLTQSLARAWDGPDAQQFVNEWWPEHRATLRAAATHVDGLGQSLFNNVSEQSDASKSGGGPSGQQPGGAVPVLTPPSTGARPVDRPGLGLGTLAPGAGRDGYISEFGAPPYPVHRGTQDGLGAFKGECTSWVAWRRKELGLDWRIEGSGTGDGGVMAGRMGGTETTAPTLGAIVSNPGEGHVMIIEEVFPDGSFRVSEMNINDVPGSFRDTRIWRPNPDGSYSGGWGKPARLVIAP